MRVLLGDKKKRIKKGGRGGARWRPKRKKKKAEKLVPATMFWNVRFFVHSMKINEGELRKIRRPGYFWTKF